MARDPLNVLRQLRRHAVDWRRQALADCMAGEADAASTIAALDQAVRRDAETAATFPDHQHFRDIFLAARQHLTAQRQRAEAALADAKARSELARGHLAAARLDAEAVERLIEERTLAAGAAADRRAQHELDDIAREDRRSHRITRNCRQ
jgi:flagellar biosynthesis chaperone FliJ